MWSETLARSSAVRPFNEYRGPQWEGGVRVGLLYKSTQRIECRWAIVLAGCLRSESPLAPRAGSVPSGRINSLDAVLLFYRLRRLKWCLDPFCGGSYLGLLEEHLCVLLQTSPMECAGRNPLSVPFFPVPRVSPSKCRESSIGGRRCPRDFSSVFVCTCVSVRPGVRTCVQVGVRTATFASLLWGR